MTCPRRRAGLCGDSATLAEINGRTKRPGGRGVSIKDVADAVEVSTATVSRALRGLPRVSRATREKIFEAALTLGYTASPTASGLVQPRIRGLWDATAGWTCPLNGCSGEPGVTGGRKAIVRLWDLPGERPTAVACTSDEMAMGVLIEAARLGLRVTGDVSVIGIEDHDFSESYGLTTVSQDPCNQAHGGIRMLLDELNGYPGALHSAVRPTPLGGQKHHLACAQIA